MQAFELFAALGNATNAAQAAKTALEGAKNESGGEGKSDFLSMLLSSADEQGAIDVAGAMKNFENSNLSSETAAEVVNVDLKNVGNSALENADFIQLLSLLESLNGGKINKFPSVSNSLEKLLATEQNVNELKAATNLNELIKIAQKLGLNLENLEITSEEAQALKGEFKQLAAKGFFETPEIKLDPLTTQKVASLVDENIANAKSEKPSGLAGLLQGLDDSAESSNLKSNLKVENPASKVAQTAPQNTPQNTAQPQNIPQTAAQPAPTMETMTAALAESEEVKQTQNKTAAAQTLSNLNTNDEGEEADSIDKYLANLMKRAMDESAGDKNETLREPLRNNSNLKEAAFSSMVSESGFELEADAPEIKIDGVSANNYVKDASANARLRGINFSETLQTFASDLQQRIQEYKPPLTRFHMTLNPAELGEVEVVMLTRANNLHINITSSNQTMQIFLQNQAEFKQNLINMGFTELEMNFSDNGEGERQRQQEQAKESAREAYGDWLASSDEPEIPPISLEIILPQYA